MKLTIPTIHMNGTSKDALVAQLETASNALRAAHGALCLAEPNARDYYPQGPMAYNDVRAEHVARLSRIESVMAEISELWEAIA